MEDTDMIKKEYQKPTVKVVKLQHQCQILAGSLQSTSTTGLDSNLDYDRNGDDQEYAW